ncbi:putative secreted protein [Sorangium cellulosum So ce56]|uniref:Secreted protein n=1 Tax=Sorangium cellulosum (strain So ce56) TaxID=448385 RepID=A9FM62_SORC5|nr:hypothetical protein [Sorangium cellulosum]CAN98299.1 putative secreted protein [Sorangium cellulosum So ce56]
MPRRILVLSSLSWLAATLAVASSAAQPAAPRPAPGPAPSASAGPPPAPGTPQPPATPQPPVTPAPGTPPSPATSAPGAPQPPASGTPQPPAAPLPGGPPQPPALGAPGAGAPEPDAAPEAAHTAPGTAGPPPDSAPPDRKPGGVEAGRKGSTPAHWALSLSDTELGPPPARGSGGRTIDEGAVPLSRRGAIGLETSSFTGGDGEVSGLAVALFARMPFAQHTFLDVRLPFGLAMAERTDAVLGNVTLGAHHVARVGRTFWLTVGGDVGLATLSGKTHHHASYEPVSASRAYWDLHEYFPSILPIHARLGAEAHVGSLMIGRFQIEPVLYIPLARNKEYEVAIQHAVELQIGHGIGGGVRVQGMALPTFDNVSIRHAVARNLYVLAVEPFLAIERNLAFLRTGLLLPFDEELGPPLDHTWGFHFTAGVRVD